MGHWDVQTQYRGIIRTGPIWISSEETNCWESMAGDSLPYVDRIPQQPCSTSANSSRGLLWHKVHRSQPSTFSGASLLMVKLNALDWDTFRFKLLLCWLSKCVTTGKSFNLCRDSTFSFGRFSDIIQIKCLVEGLISNHSNGSCYYYIHHGY